MHIPRYQLHNLIVTLCQYVLPENSVVYTGAVGDDDLAEQLRAANQREGLHDAYMVKKGEQTGACAVVITGHNRSARFIFIPSLSVQIHFVYRSLVTTLRSAENTERLVVVRQVPVDDFRECTLLESEPVIHC